MKPNPPENDRLKTPVKLDGRLRGLRPGDHGQGFKSGQSGNPGGRPKGLAALVRKMTRDGELLVSIMLDIATGKLKVNARPASHRDRMAAVEWLADRGWGKAPVAAMTLNNSVQVDASRPIEEMNVPELEAEVERLRRSSFPNE